MRSRSWAWAFLAVILFFGLMSAAAPTRADDGLKLHTSLTRVHQDPVKSPVASTPGDNQVGPADFNSLQTNETGSLATLLLGLLGVTGLGVLAWTLRQEFAGGLSSLLSWKLSRSGAGTLDSGGSGAGRMAVGEGNSGLWERLHDALSGGWDWLKSGIAKSFETTWTVIKPVVKPVAQFITGAVFEIAHRLVLGTLEPLIDQFAVSDTKSFRAGKLVGDVGLNVLGILGMIGGGTLTGSGGVLTIASGGLLSEIGVPASAAGVAVMGYSASVEGWAIAHLIQNGRSLSDKPAKDGDTLAPEDTGSTIESPTQDSRSEDISTSPEATTEAPATIENASTTAANPAADVSGAATERIDYSAGFEYDLKNFKSGAVLHEGPLDEDLYLVQYHADVPLGQGRSGKWWTSLHQGNKMAQIEDIRNDLALPPEWGARDAVTLIRIPKGTSVTYYVGEARAQVGASGQLYPGGGLQYRFKNFDPTWIIKTVTMK